MTWPLNVLRPMPGTSRTPIRPRRTLTLSRDRFGLSNGPGLIGLVFGFVFSSTGILGIIAGVSAILICAGVLPSKDEDLLRQQVWWQTLLAIAGVFLIGIGHLFIGSLLLTTLRCTFDRVKKTVTIRTGWLGLRKVVMKWSDSDRVSVRQATGWPYRGSTDPRFNIVLALSARGEFVVAYATRSPAIAQEVALEISQFTGLQSEFPASGAW
jgi:hypothetical protein